MKHEIRKKCKNPKMINLSTIEQYIFSCFHQKYFVDQYTYGSIVINNIIYNEKTNIVATFKDYLISDDISEFLKRYYTTIESSIRLPKFYEYYETYSRIYPNYTILPEAKYIYKNIHKKQKMIDKQQKNESEEKKKENKKHKRNYDKDDLVFSTDIYNSIINDSEDLYNMLFGINKNCENSEKTQEDFKKIINEINKYENPFYNDISYEKDNINSKNNNIKNNLNNYNRNIKGKLFSLCSKNKYKDSKSNNFLNGKYNNGNLLKELQLLNSFNHRKANSSTSNNTSIKKINKNSSNKINKNNNNNNKNNNNNNNNYNNTNNNNNNYNNTNNNNINNNMNINNNNANSNSNSSNSQSYNNIFPYSQKKITAKDEIKDLIDKIKVNINKNAINSSLRKGNETERIEPKNNLNALKNKINKTHNRNRNCLLNSKGNYTSHTNNNSVTKIANLNNNYNSKKIKYKGILSPKINRDKIEEKKNDNRFLDSHILKTTNNSQSSSIIKERLKRLAKITKRSFISSNNSSSRQNTNSTIKKKSYRTINHRTFFSNDKSNYNINNTQSDFKTRIKKISNNLNPKIFPNKKNIIKGFQIKNFHKILGLSDSLSPKRDSSNRFKNKVKIIKSNQKNTSKPKTTRVNQNKKL